MAVVAALVLVLAACGGDGADGGDGGDPGAILLDDDSSSSGAGDGETILDPQLVAEFDEADLPPEFDRQWIPPNYEEGAITDFAGIRGVTFAGGFTYDEAIAHYTDLLGPPAFEVGETPERLAQWMDGLGIYGMQVVEFGGEAQVGFVDVSGQS